MEFGSRVWGTHFAVSMKRAAERLQLEVMQAVHPALDGDWIVGGEEQVRARFGEFRQRGFEAALQARIDAAKAAAPLADLDHGGQSKRSGNSERRQVRKPGQKDRHLGGSVRRIGFDTSRPVR